jgi:hypothetical protein
VAPLQALQHSNLGGRLWAQLKRGDKQWPEWEKLRATRFWVEEEWRAKRDILAGKRQASQVTMQDNTLTDTGTVTEEKVVLPSNEGKDVHWGPLGGILQVVECNVLWVECNDDEGVPPAIFAAMKAHEQLHVLATGTATAVEKTIEAGTEAGAFMDCTASIISVYMTDDPALGGRGLLETSTERRALLLTRQNHATQRDHLQYAVLHTRWSPSVLAYLLDVLGVQAGSPNVVWCPHFSRADDEVVKMAAWVIASIPALHFSFTLPKGDLHGPMIHRLLQEAIDRRVGSEEVVAKEVQVLHDGLPVQSGQNSKTARELVEERKQALKNAHIQAKQEVEEELAREGLQQAASQDVLKGTQSQLQVKWSGSGNLELSQGTKAPGQATTPKKPATPITTSKATSSRAKDKQAKRKAQELEAEAPQARKVAKAAHPPRKVAPAGWTPRQAEALRKTAHLPLTGGKRLLPVPAPEASHAAELQGNQSSSASSQEEDEEAEEGSSDPPSD